MSTSEIPEKATVGIRRGITASTRAAHHFTDSPIHRFTRLTSYNDIVRLNPPRWEYIALHSFVIRRRIYA